MLDLECIVVHCIYPVLAFGYKGSLWIDRRLYNCMAFRPELIITLLILN